MDQDDLENTMRHGLQELANDAPRGEGLWNTTASMIAIEIEKEESEASPDDAPRPRKAHNPIAIGILIGLAIAAVIVGIVMLVLALTHDSGSKHGTPLLHEVIPPEDIVVNDDAAGRIAVDDASLNEVNVVEPTTDAHWRALELTRDHTRLFVVKRDSSEPCDQVGNYDLRTRQLKMIVTDANVGAITSDGAKAVVHWNAACAAHTGRQSGQYAIRDLATGDDVVLPEISGPVAVNVAFSPDGTRLAAQRVGTHHVVTYSAQGNLIGQFDLKDASQDGVGWTTDGLVLVDLGVDNTAVLRTYDPTSGQQVAVVARVPQVPQNATLVTPHVTAIYELGGRTFVEIRDNGYAQLRVVDGSQPLLVRDRWFTSSIVG